ncbi:MAG: hypothetical protein U0M00_02670 [Clostridia bacterium]|jgi:hypothetical protein|nr:hypothetical protein [Clostridia bacterium]
MEITSIFVIIAAILVFIILILALVYWKMSIDEKNGKEKKHIDVNQKDPKQQTKTPQSYNKQSIFSFMEFDKIEDNMIVQKNGKRYLMVVECQGINYDLMSRMEKNAVEEGFSQFLNTLRHPIQIYTQSRTINLDSSLENYKHRVDGIKEELDRKENQYKQMAQSGRYDEKQLQKYKFEITKQRNLYEYGKDIIFNTERMSLNKNVLRKQYYIIIPYYASEAGNDLFDKDEIRNIAFSELYTKAQSIIRTLAACSVAGKVLDSYELVDLLYNAYNRDEAETYGMKKALQAGYDELYITAQDVLDKKIRALDAQIQEKALQEARMAIEEVKSEKQKQLEQKELTIDDLIADMATQILEESKGYIGEDITKAAKKKIRTKDKGGEQDGKKTKAKSTSRVTK